MKSATLRNCCKFLPNILKSKFDPRDVYRTLVLFTMGVI